MADAGEWQGGVLPGCVCTYSSSAHVLLGWCFTIRERLAINVPREARRKPFAFSKFGLEGAKAHAMAHQRKIAEDYGLEIKNQYRYCEDPNDGLPYIEFHIRDKAGVDYLSMCDVEDLPLLEGHRWGTVKAGNNTYVKTSLTIGGKHTSKYFHNFKRPEWKVVDHHSDIPDKNRNGLDNRSKHLRDGTGGVNQANCRIQKNNKSGVNGVGYCHSRKAWYAKLGHDGFQYPPQRFYGPNDKTHPSYFEACACVREWATRVGNTNGQ